MATSQTRRERRRHKQEQEQQEQQVPDLQEAPAPQPEPSEPTWPEIDFREPPGAGLYRPLKKLPPRQAKTVRVPGPLGAHYEAWRSRHNVEFQEGTLALWRIVMREAYDAEQAALEAQRRTGVRAEIEPGPYTRELAEELQRMDEEEAGLD